MGKHYLWRCWPLIFVALLAVACATQGAAATVTNQVFPLALGGYADPQGASLPEVLAHRIRVEPVNLVGTVIFFGAIVHTFLAPMFLRLAHRVEQRHRGKRARKDSSQPEVSVAAELLHFLGEVEAVFGIWVVPLLLALSFSKGWPTAREYLGGLNFTEPLFVVVIMTMAASRPVLQISERVLSWGAALGKGTPAAWWFAVLGIGPVLGSFITEPAAMTICALLLGKKFYELRPSPRFAYATLGLLFVNISVGGTLTHFAAPPVLMVAAKWGWSLSFMFANFGWKALVGIAAANVVYFTIFRGEFKRLSGVGGRSTEGGTVTSDRGSVPFWVICIHLLFLGWTVVNNHYPALFIGGFLFYLAFTKATEHHQDELALRPALLVGFFLAGLVTHGGLQGWWIEPVLTRLNEVPLFWSATVLTAFNDNAAITYLASLVPGFNASLKYAVVAGAVVGGGLTVIANAPNPAGQSILSKYFPDGVSPLGLLAGALIPTLLMATAFLLL